MIISPFLFAYDDGEGEANPTYEQNPLLKRWHVLAELETNVFMWKSDDQEQNCKDFDAQSY